MTEPTEAERRSPDGELDQRDDAFTIPEEIVVPLKKPLKKVASDETLTQLTFRPPTVGEMKKIGQRLKSQGQEAAGILMLSLLSNDKLTDPDVERLNFIDAQICAEKLQPFLELSAPTKKPTD
jgi:hypothetical protein